MRLTFLIYCLGKFVQKIPRVFVRFLWDALDERDLCKESGMVSTSSRKIRNFTFHFILNGIFFFFLPLMKEEKEMRKPRVRNVSVEWFQPLEYNLEFFLFWFVRYGKLYIDLPNSMKQIGKL